MQPTDADLPPRARDPVLLLLSGGVDSTTLLADLRRQGHPVVAVTFDYGQRHAVEVLAAKKLAQCHAVAEHLIVHLDLQLGGASTLLAGAGSPPVATFDGPLPSGPIDTYVPARNLTFIGHAAGLAEARRIRRIIIGFNADDATNYWDCSAEFIERVNATLQLGGGNAAQVEAPYLQMTKAEVAARACHLGVDLAETVSCYAPVDGVACGRCLSCRLGGTEPPR